MTWRDFTISFATPAFLGVDPQHQPPRDPLKYPPEPRTVPFPIVSLRGPLRYWLRALVGAHVGNAMVELHRVETEVFGAASGRVGQPSRILLRARTPIPVGKNRPDWLSRRRGVTGHSAYTSESGGNSIDDFDRQHLRYLLGQGLYHPRDKNLTRRHIPIGGEEITLAVRNQGETEHATLFLAALWALRTFGGLGARVHRGFGTVILTHAPNLDTTDLDMTLLQRDSLDDLPQILTAVGNSLSRMGIAAVHSHELAWYPHFDPSTSDRRHHRCVDQPLGSGARDFSDALAHAGKLLRNQRTFGGAATYEYDEIVRPYLETGNPGVDSFKIGAYGLPVGFSDKAAGRSAVVEPVREGEPVRRASPLWLRVRKDGDAWGLRSLAFYSEWLPDCITLRIRDTTKNIPGGLK